MREFALAKLPINVQKRIADMNKFAMWTGCQECQSRLSYVPAFGAYGMTRKAGPLTVDTERALDKIAQN